MFEKLKAILVDEFQLDEADITPEAELSGDLGINSVELQSLILTCEMEFGIDIQTEDLASLTTVGDVADYLEKVVK